MKEKKINISKEFTEFPWARFIKDWPNSWEKFYNTFLSNLDIDELDKIEINLDWTYWYPSSFLSEAFNRFYKEYWEKWWRKITFISEEDPSLIPFINHLVNRNEK